MELANVFRLGAIFAFCRNVDLPLTSESIEVVDEQTAHERLNGPVNVVQRNTLLQHLVAIDIDELLRNAWQERGRHAGNLRTFARGRHECIEIGGQERDVLARAVFENEGE